MCEVTSVRVEHRPNLIAILIGFAPILLVSHRTFLSKMGEFGLKALHRRHINQGLGQAVIYKYICEKRAVKEPVIVIPAFTERMQCLSMVVRIQISSKRKSFA